MAATIHFWLAVSFPGEGLVPVPLSVSETNSGASETVPVVRETGVGVPETAAGAVVSGAGSAAVRGQSVIVMRASGGGVQGVRETAGAAPETRRRVPETAVGAGGCARNWHRLYPLRAHEKAGGPGAGGRSLEASRGGLETGCGSRRAGAKCA
ncbi:hypothetical protein R6L23_16430 [Streptomyces sp. SR27]|uniref:hypothetical protein n=1 Tax=Streptomyces sp. SR27 TaxID=3076630 RepID=UPI00295C1B19|nr:hypothetical protein [Streptomyces sp. SR27]MDV9189783.1 hypothetical protein [Streptomyces sp. SR27]